MDAGDEALLLPQRLQTHPKRHGIGRFDRDPTGLDDLRGDLFGRKQPRLSVVGDARLQVLAQFIQARQFRLVAGHADVAHEHEGILPPIIP